VTGDFTSVPLRDGDAWTSARLQQGRVLLDGDWNLNIDAAARERQHLALETIGPAGVLQGSSGFKISFAADGTLQIGAGAMWAGGLYAVNPATLAYSAQEAIAALPGSGTALLYLDAFVQEVQAAEDPDDLLDPALDGVDTTTRTRVAWRVRAVSVQATTCAGAVGVLPAELISTGRLDIVPTTPSTPADPCAPPDDPRSKLPDGLLRVEVLDTGSETTARFAWSYEDGAAAVPATVAGTSVTLAPSPSVTFFQNDLVEVSTLQRRADRLANGPLFSVANVEPGAAGSVVKLSAPSTVTGTPSGLCLRRWDGQVVGASNPVTATLGGADVGIAFTAQPGTYLAGDWWVTRVRGSSADAVDTLTAAPPDGTPHYVASLAVVDLTAKAVLRDCRPQFPSLTAMKGGCCTLEVQPSDISGSASLQTLLAGYANQGPITVCLAPGTYTLSEPLVLGKDFDDLTLEACGPGVILQAPSSPGSDFVLGLIVIEGATSVTIRGLELSAPLVRFSPPSGSFASLSQANRPLLEAFTAGLQVAIGISVGGGSADLTVEDCTFEFPDPGRANSFGAGIFATGAVDDLRITGCTFQSANPPTAVPFNDLVAGNQVQPPYQLTFGYLQVPGASAVSTKATQLLHDATIDQSLFQGVTVPVLAAAQIGTLRAGHNTVRNSYAGFWFVSIADPAQFLPFFDQVAIGSTTLYAIAAIGGNSALLDRIFVIAGAIGQVLPATPTGGGLLGPGKIQPLDTAQLTLARQTLRALVTHAVTSGGSSTTAASGTAGGTSGTGSGSSSGASGATPGAAEVSPPSAESAAAPEEVTGAAEEAKLSQLPPEIDAFLTNLGAPVAAAAASIPVADTGTSGVSMRLDLCDCQVDAIIADSYSGAGILVLDLTTETGSALLHDNRIRNRFPMGETVLVTGFAVQFERVGFGGASVTGNVVANEVVPDVANLGFFGGQVNYSMVLDAATTPLGVPAVAITGNVFVDPTKLPPRQNIPAAAAAGLGDWDLLNTVIGYIAPPVVTGVSPARGLVGTKVTVTGSGFTGATGVKFGSNPTVTALTPTPGETDTSLSVTSPSTTTFGPVDVTVINPAGTSPIVPADQFTYIRLRRAGPVPAAAAAAVPEAAAAAVPEAAAAAVPEAAAAAVPEAAAAAVPDAAPTAPIQIVPPAPAGPPLRVRVTNSADAGRAFDLHPGELTIGREEGSAIQLQDSTVSNNHALLRVSGEDATIEDLRSTNGTKVNGVVIDRQTPLAPGDQVDVGDVQLAVEQHQTTSPDQS